jgi:hypothetical protein
MDWRCSSCGSTKPEVCICEIEFDLIDTDEIPISKPNSIEYVKVRLEESK